MNLTEKFLQFSLLGANWVLWLLVMLSLASVAIIIERWIFYRGLAGEDVNLMAKVTKNLADGKRGAVAKLLKDSRSSGARMTEAMLETASRGKASIEALLNATRAQERIRLERNLSFLGTVGANAPFIGLFGTVIEILRVFNLLGEQGVASGEGAKEIMTGISEALVATAIGLLVAIPAVVAYNAFQRRVKRLLTDADGLSGAVMAHLADQNHKIEGES
ncbi:MAG: MotA/TolQ/ExbB proton channel family protein [Myxococcales bacterium FL481]|nr:MAG: MotA/TolQ/ExbB proton channel family protein [Myxococcales bacterium FL481]